ncbi:hypothetical protein [Vibrio parahaemolyticus]|uniref:hypothetical protein n=1 Tax=Vibrio parahaemolyticus TaxID=670 RepID=UPI00046FFF9F|nr:hypothetical protein [Vibrio parahaemolyticus]
MRIYYRSDLLCGKQNGNRGNISLSKRMLYSLSSKLDLQPFSLEEINSVLLNKHHSIGCSIKAPFQYVGWEAESQWYELFKGEEEIFLPKNINFTDGKVTYFIVVIGEQYELRVWRDSHCFDRDENMWFSHEPVVSDAELNMLKNSFYTLITHIQREEQLFMSRNLRTGSGN